MLKTREALAFVIRKGNDKKTAVLYAVAAMPDRTVAPKETAHYILFSGNKNKRYKMKINTVTFAKTETGKLDKTKVVKATPNFEEVTGTTLKEMYNRCCPAFKKTFPLD